MGEHYFFVNTLWRKVYLYCIYHVCMLWYFKENPVCVSLKHVLHFDEQNSNLKKEKEENKKNIQLTTFWDTCDTTKHSEN